MTTMHYKKTILSVLFLLGTIILPAWSQDTAKAPDDKVEWGDDGDATDVVVPEAAAKDAAAVNDDNGEKIQAPAATGHNVVVAPATAAENIPKLSPEEIEANEVVKRKEKMLEAEQLYKEGREAYIKGDFETASGKFVAAEIRLKEASPSKKAVLAKRQMINKLLSHTYEEWAEKLAKEAKRLSKLQSYDDAISKYQKVMQLNPKRKDEMNKIIRELQKDRKKAEFKEKTSPARVNPEKAIRDEEIDVLLAQGKVYFDDKRYSDARELFEQVLLKDAYNIKATQFLRRINERFSIAAKERRAMMKAERLAEIQWKWADSVAPMVGSEQNPLNTEVVAKSSKEANSTREKLKNIIIPKISFDEATIQSVVKYLKQRSRELDPAGEGVNIFLQLQAPGATPGEAAPTGADTSTGDGADSFNFDTGGADTGGADTGGADTGGADTGAADTGGEDLFSPDGGGDAQAPAANEITITMDFDSIPLGEAIRYICQGAGLKFRIEKYAVIIASKDVPFDVMETRIYPVQPGFMAGKKTMTSAGGFKNNGGDDDDDTATSVEADDPLTFFTKLGVDFPQGAKITYNTRTSRLIVTNTPDNLRKVEMLLKELDIQPTQVTIEAKFVEVSQTDLDEMGFDWLFLGQGNAFDDGTTDKDVNLSGDSKFRIFKQTGGAEESLSGGMRFAAPGMSASNDKLLKINSIISGLQFQTVIRALAQKSGADILSSPKVTTMSGNTAVIKMVNERYFPESWSEPTLQAGSSSGGTTTGASYTPSIPEFGEAREIGVILEVTPIVGSDGYSIELEMNPEVLEFSGFDDYSYKVTISGDTVDAVLKMPIISKRSLSTKVIVWDGETVVLGGMIIERVEEINDKVPILGDMPVLGRLFQNKANKSEKRNLLIFVSARLVNPAGLPIRTLELQGLPDFRH